MYSEASQYLSTQLSRACNVPAYMISADMNGSYTYNNILDARKDFVSTSLQPFLTAIEDRLSMDDLTPRGQVVRFSIDETYLRADAVTRLNVIEKMLSLGLITVDQARGMEDLVPNGETGVDINLQ